MKTISQEDAEKCLARDGNFIPADTDLNQKEVIGKRCFLQGLFHVGNHWFKMITNLT